MTKDTPGLVDPDPFTLAQTFFAAASFALQFVQVRGALPTFPQSVPTRSTNLGSLEDHAAQCAQNGKQIIRTLERGVEDVDRDFFDKPYRVGSAMFMDMASHSQFKTQLANFMNTVANTGLWVNHIIENDPEMAARLGERLHQNLDGLTERLNTVMEKGSANREAVQAAKEALAGLAAAIEAEFRGMN